MDVTGERSSFMRDSETGLETIPLLPAVSGKVSRETKRGWENYAGSRKPFGWRLSNASRQRSPRGAARPDMYGKGRMV